MPYHQVRVLHEAEDDLVEHRSKVRFELDRDPLSYEPNDTSTNQLVPAEENGGKEIHECNTDSDSSSLGFMLKKNKKNKKSSLVL